MAKKKVYAVKKGRQTGLFDTWDECKSLVHGFPGAVYKSFETRQEAEAYLNGENGGIQNQASGQSDKIPADRQLIAYVDGSFSRQIRRYSFGCVLITPDGEIIRESGSDNQPKSLALRNVAGEMLGAMYAVQWAQTNGYLAVDIRYDYAGIEQWATHGWQAKNELTQKYAEYMNRCGEQIAITFTKIAAHTGDRYNEEADRLAKEALTEKDGIPKV
mgnify:CR=1 FL=1